MCTSIQTSRAARLFAAMANKPPHFVELLLLVLLVSAEGDDNQTLKMHCSQSAGGVNA
jgi:hypothetical protein